MSRQEFIEKLIAFGWSVDEAYAAWSSDRLRSQIIRKLKKGQRV